MHKCINSLIKIKRINNLYLKTNIQCSFTEYYKSKNLLKTSYSIGIHSVSKNIYTEIRQETNDIGNKQSINNKIRIII